MKKTCAGCRALLHRDPFNCSLGYDMDHYIAKPKEECPKPKTINSLIIERNKLFFKKD